VEGKRDALNCVVKCKVCTSGDEEVEKVETKLESFKIFGIGNLDGVRWIDIYYLEPGEEKMGGGGHM